MTEFQKEILLSVQAIVLLLKEGTGCSGPCSDCPHGKKTPVVQQASQLPEWMTPQEVMAYLRISRTTFFKFKKRGLLLPHRLGGTDYFAPAELDNAFKESVRKGRI